MAAAVAFEAWRYFVHRDVELTWSAGVTATGSTFVETWALVRARLLDVGILPLLGWFLTDKGHARL